MTLKAAAEALLTVMLWGCETMVDAWASALNAMSKHPALRIRNIPFIVPYFGSFRAGCNQLNDSSRYFLRFAFLRTNYQNCYSNSCSSCQRGDRACAMPK